MSAQLEQKIAFYLTFYFMFKEYNITMLFSFSENTLQVFLEEEEIRLMPFHFDVER